MAALKTPVPTGAPASPRMGTGTVSGQQFVETDGIWALGWQHLIGILGSSSPGISVCALTTVALRASTECSHAPMQPCLP